MHLAFLVHIHYVSVYFTQVARRTNPIYVYLSAEKNHLSGGKKKKSEREEKKKKKKKREREKERQRKTTRSIHLSLQPPLGCFRLFLPSSSFSHETLHPHSLLLTLHPPTLTSTHITSRHAHKRLIILFTLDLGSTCPDLEQTSGLARGRLGIHRPAAPI